MIMMEELVRKARVGGVVEVWAGGGGGGGGD